MTTRTLPFLLLFVFAHQTLAKPLEVLQNPEPLNPLQQPEVPTVDNERGQRSPQFGFLDGDFSSPDSDFVPEERRFKHHHRKHHHKPGYGEYPEYAGYPVPSPVVYPVQPVAPVHSGGSFATASAGSTGYGGQSQANAQSATLNFGPFSASFSNAEASAGGVSY